MLARSSTPATIKQITYTVLQDIKDDGFAATPQRVRKAIERLEIRELVRSIGKGQFIISEMGHIAAMTNGRFDEELDKIIRKAVRGWMKKTGMRFPEQSYDPKDPYHEPLSKADRSSLMSLCLTWGGGVKSMKWSPARQRKFITERRKTGTVI